MSGQNQRHQASPSSNPIQQETGWLEQRRTILRAVETETIEVTRLVARVRQQLRQEEDLMAAYRFVRGDQMVFEAETAQLTTLMLSHAAAVQSHATAVSTHAAAVSLYALDLESNVAAVASYASEMSRTRPTTLAASDLAEVEINAAEMIRTNSTTSAASDLAVMETNAALVASTVTEVLSKHFDVLAGSLASDSAEEARTSFTTSAESLAAEVQPDSAEVTAEVARTSLTTSAASRLTTVVRCLNALVALHPASDSAEQLRTSLSTSADSRAAAVASDALEEARTSLMTLVASHSAVVASELSRISFMTSAESHTEALALYGTELARMHSQSANTPRAPGQENKRQIRNNQRLTEYIRKKKEQERQLHQLNEEVDPPTTDNIQATPQPLNNKPIETEDPAPEESTTL